MAHLRPAQKQVDNQGLLLREVSEKVCEGVGRMRRAVFDYLKKKRWMGTITVEEKDLLLDEYEKLEARLLKFLHNQHCIQKINEGGVKMPEEEDEEGQETENQ